MDSPLRLFDDMTILGRIGDVAFMVFAYPCVVIYLFFYGDGSSPGTGEAAQRAKRHEKATKAAMKERKRNEPSVLPPNSRDLSIWPQPKSPSPRLFGLLNHIEPSPQTNVASPFFRLPLEIREKIYSEVLGHDTLHIVQLPKRLGHLRCTASKTSYTHNNIICNRECFHPSVPIQTYRHGEFINVEGTSDNSLSLIQTCRQIYNEASLVLYQTNTFDINHPQTLLFLARTILPSRLASIRNLNLTWSGILPFLDNDTNKAPDDLKTWEDAWKIIAGKMPALRIMKLRMLIYEDEFEVNRSGPFLQHARKRWTTNGVQFEKILEVMKENVRGLREFHLGVELPEDIQWNIADLEDRLRETVCSPKN